MKEHKYFVFKLNNDENRLVFIEGYDKVIGVQIIYNLFIRKALYTLYGEYNKEEFNNLMKKNRITGYNLDIYNKYAYIYE